MAERMTTYCDGCGKAKGEANHWHKAVLFGPSVHLAGEPLEVVAMLIGNPGRTNVTGTPESEKDFCGDKCLLEYAQGILKAGA